MAMFFKAAATSSLAPPVSSLRCASTSIAAVERHCIVTRSFANTARTRRRPRTSNPRPDSFILSPPPPPLTATRFSSTQASSPDRTLPDTVRQLMRTVPHPVAIITSTSTYTTDSSTKTNRSLNLFKGATVSSFNTVTLTPEPIVSFNITQQSSTFSAIQLSGLFNVHLLTHAPEARVIADKFASGNQIRPFHDFAGNLESWVDLKASSSSSSLHSREAFDSLSSTPDSSTSKKARFPPAIRSQPHTASEVVAFRLLCEHLTEKTVSIGDHVVVFGRVIEAVDHYKASDKALLSYVRGGYAWHRALTNSETEDEME